MDNDFSFFPYESANSIIDFKKGVKNIYDHIIDARSKEIFGYRLMLSLTESPIYARKLIGSTAAGKHLYNTIKKKRIFLYGAGKRGCRFKAMFPELQIVAYIDKYRTGKINDLPIMKLDGLQNDEDVLILITNIANVNEIESDIKEKGNWQILKLNDYEESSMKEIYYDSRCIKYFSEKDGVFVDAGSFDGEDCLRFINSSLCHEHEIYAFEPDGINFQNCKMKLQGIDNVKIFQMGLSTTEGYLNFIENDGEAARFSEEGNSSIEVASLDKFVGSKKVAYIKMDIEGKEKDAILGAKNILKRDEPNMMISLYHKKEDIVDIPQSILDVNSRYKFVIEHYGVGSTNDTVLYAFT